MYDFILYILQYSQRQSRVKASTNIITQRMWMNTKNIITYVVMCDEFQTEGALI